jgi:hypothetical protein
MNLRSSITSSALAIAGFGLWSYAGSQLKNNGNFEYDPNPLGLKRSPYGQVIAMAIQAPIDADWHGGLEIHDMPPAPGESHDEDHACEDEHCDHDHSVAQDEHGSCGDPDCDHDHGHVGHDHALAENKEHAGHEGCSDPHCTSDHGASDPAPRSLISRLSKAVTQRTNHHPPSPAHKFYLRQEIEKKLRFAYNLDPSHYANYNAYNLFITESTLGTSKATQGVLNAHAIRLAEGTMRYCLSETTDPRPALTAASAAYNIFERRMLSEDKPSTNELREQLAMIDFCLNRHFQLLQESFGNGLWASLSPLRQKEVTDRSAFTLKLRDSAEKTIMRLETPDRSTVGIDPS